ncbi:hypothetical protein GWI33_016262 [Rhynchophorus ferrugineus]|uniref:Uncharacterized protein n=1 Tax=Rhynchophorus ferrugineus TaxID=354439 RepID=A0A834M3H6_RHYFE|nr:hypothetical protein GWI33_016262 [Rhynchophorus ferrugineus]
MDGAHALLEIRRPDHLSLKALQYRVHISSGGAVLPELSTILNRLLHNWNLRKKKDLPSVPFKIEDH